MSYQGGYLFKDDDLSREMLPSSQRSTFVLCTKDSLLLIRSVQLCNDDIDMIGLSSPDLDMDFGEYLTKAIQKGTTKNNTNNNSNTTHNNKNDSNTSKARHDHNNDNNTVDTYDETDTLSETTYIDNLTRRTSVDHHSEAGDHAGGHNSDQAGNDTVSYYTYTHFIYSF